MLRNVLLKTLRDSRRSLLFWGMGLLLLNLYVVLFYPSIRESGEELTKLIEQMPDVLKATFLGEGTDFTSPVGYLSTELFSFMGPLLFLFLTIGFGSAAIAGEEDRGTLDLLLANPVSRTRVVLDKFGAMVAAVLALAIVFWGSLVLGARVVDMDIALWQLAAGTASLVLLALAFGALALALGAALGNRGLSIGVCSALAVAAYFLNSMANAVEALKPYQKLSPFYYYGSAEPLRNGLDAVHVVVLVALVVVFLVAGLVTFQRRDLAV